MRRRLRLLLLLLVGTAAIAVALQLRQPKGHHSRRFSQYLRSKSVRSVQTYLVEEKRYLEFALPPGAERVRFLSNAATPEGTALEMGQKLRYAFEVEFLGGSGKLLRRATQYQLTSPSRYRDPLTNRVTAASFYNSSSREVLGTRLLIWRLPRSSPRKMRVRLLSKSPLIHDLVLRVYVEQKISASKIRYRWQRLRAEAKERLTRANVYPPNLVSENEIRNSLGSDWLPLPPEGLVGRDYAARKLYVLREAGIRENEEIILPAGMLLQTDWHGTIRLPEAGAKIRFSVQRLTEDSSPEPIRITWHWYGQGVGNQREGQFRLSSRQDDFVANFAGGLVELTTTKEVVVRLFRQENSDPKGESQEDEITPAPKQLRGYLCLPGQTVAYRVQHLPGKAAPLRIQLRQILPASKTSPREAKLATSLSVTLTMLDQEGKVFNAAVETFPAAPSLYDRYPQGNQNTLVGQPVSLYFFLPPKCAELRLRAERVPLIIVGMNRSPLRPRRTLIPEDYFGAERSAAQERAWFFLRATNHDSLNLQSRWVPIITRDAPPKAIDPRILAGNYRWETFTPQGSWQGRYLLVPEATPTSPSALAPLRLKTLLSRFTLCPLGREVSFRFDSPANMRPFAPQLLLIKSSDQPGRVRVWWDGKKILEREVLAPQQTFTLPEIMPGQHRLRVQADSGTRVYVNHVSGKNLPATYRKRLATRLLKAQEFVVQKEETEELLRLQVYQPTSNQTSTSQRLKIHIRISGAGIATRQKLLGPFLDQTFLDREYRVRPSLPVQVQARAQVQLLGAAKSHLDAGQPLFIPLHADLPLGTYKILVEVETRRDNFTLPTRPIYVILSRTLPERGEERSIKIESQGL